MLGASAAQQRANNFFDYKQSISYLVDFPDMDPYSSPEGLQSSNGSPGGSMIFTGLNTLNGHNAPSDQSRLSNQTASTQDLSRAPPIASALPAIATPSADSRAAAPTVPAACLACRSKHLKCDGLNPCSRCRTSDSICQYVASRRGYKGPRRNTAQNPNKRHASDSPPSAAGDSCPMLLGATIGTPAGPALATFNPILSTPATPLGSFDAPPSISGLQLYRAPYMTGADGALIPANQARPPQTIPERCVDSFFYHFYAGHPAVLPKEHLLRLAKDMDLDHLLAAIRWAGSLYIDVGPQRATFLEEALKLVYSPDVAKDAFLIQAMVILIVGLDGSCQQEKARDILSDVERIAIEIGLYQRSYATANGQGNPMLEESFRRTWWDLFVVDGMVAGVHRATNFLLFDIVADVALPCEEYQYTSGQIPRPSYLEDFDDQLFSGEEQEFSSFAYRIAAIRNLGRMMRLPESIFPGDENIDRIETLLSNWRMHLPATKRDCLDKDCKLDEMMFQARMINYACSIMLHQPHSQLDTSPAREVTACAPHQMVRSGDNFNIHTRHIISAASEISKMVTYAVPITCHTHFFTCVLTLSSIVHLSKWSLYFVQNDDDLRQQIRLNIGALNQLSSVWGAAANASRQVKGVAQEIYRSKRAQQTNTTFWVGFTQEEIISSMASDESIMGEINTMLQP